jgi:hypothetical protein
MTPLERGKLQHALEEHLHPDWVAQYDTLADAMLKAVKSVEAVALEIELGELAALDDEALRRALGTHAVHLWDRLAPRADLAHLQALSQLV